MWWTGNVGRMKISDIEQHRKEKLESLLCGNLDKELAQLRALINESTFSDKQRESIEEILIFVMAQHYGDHPLLKFYVSHPIRVGVFALNWMKINNDYDYDFLVASLIHNVIEKNILNASEINSKYGQWVSRVIETITVDREAQKKDGWAEEYYSRLSSLDTKGKLLKAFDKFDNIYAICLNPDENVRNEYLDEIIKYIKPIIDKYSSEQSEYFLNLVDKSRAMGYLSIDEFLKDYQ